MAEQNVTVTLTESERLELEQIIMDGDPRAALAFLKRAVHAKVERAEKGR